MHRTFIFVLLLAILPKTVSARGFTQEETNDMAHFALSYVVTNASYGFYKKAFHLDAPEDKWFAMVLAGTTGFAVGSVKEAMDATNGGKFDLHDIGTDALGISAAIGLGIAFDF